MPLLVSPRGKYAVWFTSLLLLISSVGLLAEGTPNLRTASGDPVLLFLGQEDFGDFASYGSPENSRLNFRVGSLDEVVYFGMARLFNNSGDQQNFGQYRFRVRSAVSDEVVFGPVTVNANTENLTTYEQAAIGPDVLGVGGYPTSPEYVFTPPDAGEYYIEFERNSANRARYIGLWDITILKDGEEQTGRVYSKNWAFRVPETIPELPYCAFGAELSTVFYSYTSDGFVTQIDFTDSGFQPLSFNLAFNRTGPGSTGDLAFDRMSIAEANATANAAEHLIFLSEPDPLLFPDGECGSVQVAGEIQCQAENTYCIPVESTLSGQVEIVLDFNGNGIFDDGLDRLLLYQFDEERGFSACVPWDGLRGDGVIPEEGTTVDILVEYTQGLQHWALYDGELMRNGFCVTPIRPICGDGGDAALYYDDTNIPDEPGTGAPKKVLDGCACGTAECRTWTNFEANASDDCTIINDNTTGYGDRNTLNTWWFASSVSVASFDVPVDVASIEGPKDHCPGEAVVLELNYNSSNAIGAITWTGPQGVITTMPGQMDITVSETGLYTVEVADEFDCMSSAEFVLLDVACMLNVNVLSVVCDDAGTDTDPGDDVFFATVRVDGENSPSYRYNGILRPYGEEIVLGPFFVADGEVVVTATDSEYDCCQESITIPAPMPCSNGCAITAASIIRTECGDNGTPTDPSDDLWTFDIYLNGINLSGEWVNDRGETGVYGDTLTFGPFPIAEGSQEYQFVDSEDDGCTIFSTVQPPMPCSYDCALLPTVANLSCSDAGTPYDGTDDTFTFDLSVEGINAPSVAYNVNGAGAYLYDQTNTFGPYPIAGNDFTFLIADLGGGDCAISYTLEETPVSCSDACGIDITETRIVCDDAGTDDPEDDLLYVELLVESLNPVARGWVAANGPEGDFGAFVRVGTISPGGDSLTFSVTDLDNAECSASVTVSSPVLEVSCPDDVGTVPHRVSLQTVADSLTPQSDFTAGDQLVCWMEAEGFGSPRRYLQRYTVQRTDSSPGLRLFSFYLYGEPGAQLLGGVFSQRSVEDLDCCNLTNDGPVGPLPSNPASLPVLPDSLRPAQLSLRQRFSVVLRPGEEYSLVTSSPVPGTTGAFRWLIVSADQEELAIDRVDAPAPEQTFAVVDAIFALHDSEVPAVQNVAASTSFFGAPTVDSLCGAPIIAFNDSLQSTCDRALLLRRFDVTAGDTVFTSVCTQEIEFRALGLMDLSWPEQQLAFGCSDEFPQLPNGAPHPDYSGYPFVYRAGLAVALDSSALDDLRITYADVVEELADGGRRITRTWTVSDLCRLNVAIYNQVFKLESNGIPYFLCPVNNHFCPIVEEDIMLWQVGSFDCVADVIIPEPELVNVCDTTDWTFLTEVLRITETGDTLPFLTLEFGDDRLIAELTLGDYLIRYLGVHPTETIDPTYCRFRVADLTEPVAICKSNLNLSVPGTGFVQVGVPQINQGSYDNCGVVLEEVRRQLPAGHPAADSLGWSPWQSFVIFDCEDVGLAWRMEYRLWDAAGNVNFCHSTVVITDNTDPYCVGLEEQFVSCDDLPDGFSAFDTTGLRLLFGMPEVIDNCSAHARELPPIVDGDDCSPERIRRRFTAIDQHGNASAGLFFQDINVTPSLAYAIGFPADLATDCSDLTDTLHVIGTGCDSITVSYTDIPLSPQGDECRRFQRTFTVTNWCEWDGSSPAIPIGRDEDCDNTNGEVAVWLVRTNEGIFVDGDSLITNAFPAENTRGILCGGENPEGYFREVTGMAGGRYTYSQRIQILDTTAPEINLTMIDTICVDTSLCRTSVTVGVEILDACQVDEGEILIAIDNDNDGTIDGSSATLGTLTGAFPNYTFTVSMPIGEHRLVFTVTDDCGNTGEYERVFRVNDCYVPVLECGGDRIYDLVSVLEPGDIDGDGEIEEAAVLVEASDLARCNFGDCSGNLVFSVNRVGERADREQHTMFLDCEDRYQVALEVYVWDEAFNPFAVQPDGTVGGNNWRMCVVEVFVQDPDLVCNNCTAEGTITLGGNISTRGGAPLEAVLVSSSDEGGWAATDAAGDYRMPVAAGGEYVLRPEANFDPRAGLSTIDVLMIQFHLLGVQPITDPYLLLAADVNRDGEVSSLDLIMIRALVIGNEAFYPANSTWRFFPRGWDGTGTPPDYVEVRDVLECGFDHDFTGIKLGDLNNTLGANFSAETGGGAAGAVSGTESGVGRSRPLALLVEDAEFSVGELVTATIRLPEAGRYAGGQAGLRWNGQALALLNYAADYFTPRNTRQRRNQLRFSWSDALNDNDLVTLSFRALAAGSLREALSLEGAVDFRDEVYTSALATHPVYLEWTAPGTRAVGLADKPEVLAEDPSLGVYPNPAVTVAYVGMRLPEGQQVTIVVHDAAGREVLKARPFVSAGEQWVPLELGDWPTGEYFIAVRTKHGSTTNQIVKYENLSFR